MVVSSSSLDKLPFLLATVRHPYHPHFTINPILLVCSTGPPTSMEPLAPRHPRRLGLPGLARRDVHHQPHLHRRDHLQHERCTVLRQEPRPVCSFPSWADSSSMGTRRASSLISTTKEADAMILFAVGFRNRRVGDACV